MTRLAGFSWLASVDGAVVLQEKDVGVTTDVTPVRQTFCCSLDQFSMLFPAIPETPAAVKET
jgi:hypothetical protein